MEALLDPMQNPVTYAAPFFVLAILVVLALAWIVIYNRFKSQQNLISESWKQIDVELQRRFDLIPNLIETVKGYAAHERSVIESVTAARTAAT